MQQHLQPQRPGQSPLLSIITSRPFSARLHRRLSLDKMKGDLKLEQKQELVCCFLRLRERQAGIERSEFVATQRRCDLLVWIRWSNSHSMLRHLAPGVVDVTSFPAGCHTRGGGQQRCKGPHPASSTVVADVTKVIKLGMLCRLSINIAMHCGRHPRFEQATTRPPHAFTRSTKSPPTPAWLPLACPGSAAGPAAP